MMNGKTRMMAMTTTTEMAMTAMMIQTKVMTAMQNHLPRIRNDKQDSRQKMRNSLTTCKMCYYIIMLNVNIL